ncbi:hypothetical protein KJS94_14780 [Flavihumibacter rivuli]|uniref:hypothetical protein n=1 Tax=Flavihumibacter rivuli TaxID=2838156 RepID=UPI001BDE4C30|nr:hypothetical protein [Flavihumibacter rivuli]ULQ55913.1 hypothetical protein KJS94_14780 [Flavihumibacter rivuli]
MLRSKLDHNAMDKKKVLAISVLVFALVVLLVAYVAYNHHLNELESRILNGN